MLAPHHLYTEAEQEEIDASFEFPELTADSAHRFVAAPAIVFDSFDCWHGSGTWVGRCKLDPGLTMG